MELKHMSGIELKPMKIHTQKGKRRLWLEQQRYGLDGFAPGSSFKVTYHTDSIEIESDPEGSNKVFTRVKKASKLHPTERQFAMILKMVLILLVVMSKCQVI